MKENLIYAFEIMGKGMLSIFAVIILITLIVMLMTKLSENKKDKHKEA